jgi:hypothetical protein
MRRALPACTHRLIGPFVRLHWLRAASRIAHARQPGQSVVEASLTALLSVSMILVTLQLSLVAAQAYSASHVARTTARWLAVRVDTIDSAVRAQAATNATGLPGLSGGGMASVVVTPSCVALVSGKCPGRESGDAVTVTVTTSLAPVMFLPTTFGIPPLQFRLPASMPPIAFTVLLE